MPCDTIQTNQIELGAMNAELLKRALKALGAAGVYVDRTGAYFTLQGVPCQIRGGKLIIEEGNERLADVLKREYSVQTVKYTAQRNGWSLKKVAEYQYEVTK